MGRVVREGDSGELTLGHRNNPDAFTLSTDERGGTSATRQVFWAVFIGFLGIVLTAIGGGALVTVLPALTALLAETTGT